MGRENLLDMDRGRLLASLGAAVLLLLWAAAPAFAAPQRLAADPEPGAELHEAPERVTLTFSEPLDESSEIRVFDDCDRRLDDGATTVDINEMSVGIAKTPSGTYTVVYLAVGVTGSTNDGYAFTVMHAGPACDGGSGGHDHGGGEGDGDEGGHGEGHGGGEGSGGHEGTSGGDHEGHGGTSTGGHSGMDHGATGEGKHQKKGHGKHGKGKHGKHGKHGGKNDKGNDDAGNPPLAAGPTGTLVQPSLAAVLVALTLASMFGALGGWVLRVSSRS